jgi:DNA-binding MarR family transcriptional regulator
MATRRTTKARTTRWLTAEEEAAWRVIASVVVRLPWALECQLQRDSDLSFIEYHALAMLSEQPNHTLRMSELAVLTNASLSRLSHLIKRLEARRLVRREPDPSDGRYTNAILTKSGYTKLVAAAPEHVETVRRLVIDAIDDQDLPRVHDAAKRILSRLADGD